MKSHKKFSRLYAIVLILIAANVFTACKDSKPEKNYKPTWESLATHPVPQWYQDAKFGIFIHWGVYSVPAYHEWYVEFISPKSSFGRNLGGPPYTAAQGNFSDSVFHANIREDANKYHRKNYGVDFAYDEFIPMFKAENYDPASWADLFKQAGARYVVMTAKHGDEFALWPSEYTDRNAGDMGPQRDLVGDLTSAVRAEGMKMGLYHNTTYSFWDERYPNKEWVEYMNNTVKELVDRYHPDILWGDVVIGPARDDKGKPLGAEHWNSKEVIAYFYNHSENPDEVLTNDRWGLDTSVEVDSKKALSRSVWTSHANRWNTGGGALLGDFQTPERRNITEIFDHPWETCDALDPTSWGYNRQTPEEEYMSTNELVDYLADIVSKGGNLLINIGPKADGAIPEVMKDRLRGVGNWLSENGEAIYGTTPWSVYGEGPTKKEVGSWGREKGEYRFQPGDVRFTRKGNTLYAILLEWPGDEITLNFLKKVNVSHISLLGSDEEIHWEKTSDDITVFLPSEPVSSYANTLRLECEAL
ncbi:MAG: alpha-L-fucosidase [Bacteroidales bacterium]|nr:alpha-L-fucosidase [Bacteroidales bacterium]